MIVLGERLEIYIYIYKYYMVMNIYVYILLLITMLRPRRMIVPQSVWWLWATWMQGAAD